jgi:hypothetical protein
MEQLKNAMILTESFGLSKAESFEPHFPGAEKLYFVIDLALFAGGVCKVGQAIVA